MAIPFVRQFEFEYGALAQLSPLIQRVIARNPGPFTFIGGDSVAVIDPGPDLAEHRAALDKALEGRRVSHVLMTHHHIDHSPLAIPLAKYARQRAAKCGSKRAMTSPLSQMLRFAAAISLRVMAGRLRLSTRLATPQTICALRCERKIRCFLAITWGLYRPPPYPRGADLRCAEGRADRNHANGGADVCRCR